MQEGPPLPEKCSSAEWPISSTSRNYGKGVATALLQTGSGQVLRLEKEECLV